MSSGYGQTGRHPPSQLPATAKGDVDDLYADGKIEIIRSSVSPEDVCSEFTAQVNTIEYTAEYVAGGVEVHCRGVGANYNHLPLLINDVRLASLHPHYASWTLADCDPQRNPPHATRECVDLTIGIEGRVVQRTDVFVYLYYRVCEQRFNPVTKEWIAPDPNVDTLVITNDPNPLYASAYVSNPVRLAYLDPKPPVPVCDYRAPGHPLETLRPDDTYIGSFRADLPQSYQVARESNPRKQFVVYVDVDMIHQVEIGGSEAGVDHRINAGTYDDPVCSASATQVGSGLWNYSGRKLCPGGTADCELWIGPPAEWKEFDLYQPTVTPTPLPTPTIIYITR